MNDPSSPGNVPLYRRLVETSNVIPWEYEAHTQRFTYVGPQAERHFGYPLADWFRPGFWASILHPEDRDMALTGCAERAAFFAEYELEYRVRTASGGVVWVHDFVNVRTEADGRRILSGFLVDITQRRQSEEEIETSRQHLELLVRRSPLAVIEWNPTIEVVTWNPAAAAIFGYTAEEARGQPFTFIVLPEDVPELTRVSQQVIHQTGGFRHDNRNVTKDGRIIDCEWYNSPLIDEQGQTVGLMSLVMDVTVRKRAADEIQRLNAELEQRVAERTRQLQAANKELEAFCYSVSHDLRAPLRTVDGFSKVLLEDYLDRLDAEGQDSLHRIRAASRRMGELIDDLLTLSRVSRSSMATCSVDLRRMATIIVANLRAAHPQRQVDFILGADLNACGDPNLLRLALENLLSNAWKYTSKHATARIEFNSLPDPSRPVFYIRDDGAGFDPKYAAKLFQPFQRLHRPDEFEGHGIGLATVQRIIHRHGGEVWAKGAVEQGATFYFTLGATESFPSPLYSGERGRG